MTMCCYRCFFPNLLISLSGLEPTRLYTIALRIMPMDNYRYKYDKNIWRAVEETEANQNHQKQIFRHPYSPSYGQSWMSRPINFNSAKITNCSTTKNENVRIKGQSLINVNSLFSSLPPPPPPQHIFRLSSMLCTSM